MGHDVVDVGNIKLWYETFGKPEDTPILLITGAGSQGILWSTDFCKKLANNLFYEFYFRIAFEVKKAAKKYYTL